jgi:acyl-CoA synthetase (NDP forming)
LSVNAERLRRVFSPRSVAVVGDKQAMGFMWLRNMLAFQGPVYSVQINPKETPGIEALGVPNYQSLLDIPGEIDYVVCAVPRVAAPRIVADCVKKGVGGVSLFTSGFAETGEEEGIRLQEEIARLARDNGLVLVGPNCMGVYNPALGVRQSADQPTGESGPVGLISQSGTHAIAFSLLGAAHGLRISKSVSMGNGAVVDASDYLEFLAGDEETRVIALYLEGVGDGRRFFRVLRETVPRKPVVIWKGGQTEAGQRGAASHTAALATASAVWEALVRQTGVVTTDSLDETVDAVKSLLYLKPPAGGGSASSAKGGFASGEGGAIGYRVGLMAMTGGQSVVIGDAFAREGLEVPLLTASSYQKLASFFNIIGGSYRNPLDIGGTVGWGGSRENLERMLDILNEDEHVDAVALEMGSGFMARRWQADPKALEQALDALAAYQERSPKPFLTIMHPGHVEAVVAELRERVTARGIAVFPSFERAARALRRFLDYHRFRAEVGAAAGRAESRS